MHGDTCSLHDPPAFDHRPGSEPAAPQVFIARQPIVDRRRRVLAYELLFRAGAFETACTQSNADATARLVRTAFHEIGIEIVLGRCLGFVNADAQTLHSPLIEALPPERVVIELLETVRVDRTLVSRCRELKRMGFRLALDDFAGSEEWEPLLPLVDIVKVDMAQIDTRSLADLVSRLRLHPARLLAEKIETPSRARECLRLGFELFQGFLFGRPAVLVG
jgi:EAL and modified HD-GYP domain-containing signal transduction protein